ncbi:MAG: AraC family ligand binding domain-containing protein [Bacteroidales bacterium]|nr:AraC family ligand binding domain-containing protein [Bacteroidales bacterium]
MFEPGVINARHTRPSGQILIVTDGIGYHLIEGQPVEELRPGDVVMCPPDVMHWHDASANSRFDLNGWTVCWLDGNIDIAPKHLYELGQAA